MATTSSNLVAGKAIGGQGGNGRNGRFGLAAKLASGAAILGCVGALTFGGLQMNNAGQTQPQAARVAAQPPAVVNTTSDLGTEFDPYIINGSLPRSTSQGLGSLDWEQQERTQAAPAAFYPDQFTYREDRRVDVSAPFYPDQFTYREDRRIEKIDTFFPDQFTYREDRRVESPAQGEDQPGSWKNNDR